MRPAPRYVRTLAATALLGLVAVEDVVIARVDLPVPIHGPVDWLAHLATTGIAVLAVGPRDLRPHTRFLTIVAGASVAIDVDHVPIYLHLVEENGRPATHSLLTPGVLGAAGVADRRHRSDFLAAAAGVGLHLVRDVGTGPGVRLLAPVVGGTTRLRWTTYAAVLGALVALVAVRDAAA